MTRSMRVFFLAVVSAILIWRILHPGSSFPGHFWDYGTHLSIANSLNQGHLFQESISEHAVVSFLPIYHGLIVSHLIALVPHSLGLPLSMAFLIVSDLAFLLLIFSALLLLQKQKNIFHRVTVGIVIFGLALPIFGYFASQGMYSQIVSVGFLGMTIWSLEKKYNHWAALSFGLGIFCYPDIGLWVLPLFFIHSMKGVFSKLSFSLYIVLLASFFLRSHLEGYVDVPLENYFLLAVVLVVLVGRRFNNISLFSPNEKVATIYITSLFVMSVLSLIIHAELRYYFLKLYFLAPVMLVLFLASAQSLSFKKNAFIIGLTFLTIWKQWETLELGYTHYFYPESSFNAELEINLNRLSTLMSCSNMLVIPSRDLLLSKSYESDMFYIAANSFFNPVNIYTAQVQSPLLVEEFRPVLKLTQALRIEQQRVFNSVFKQMMLSKDLKLCTALQKDPWDSLVDFKEWDSHFQFTKAKNWIVYSSFKSKE